LSNGLNVLYLLMQFTNIIGQEPLKNYLTKTSSNKRIAHAQLFVGEEGSGVLPMAIAYAQYILCNNINGENKGGNVACNLKFESFSHPDLHYIYPTFTTDVVKTKPKSSDFLNEWLLFLKEKPYGSLLDWYSQLDVKNKQGEIRVEDAQEILKSLSLKSYEGGYKIMIIWMADKMNIAAANKLLKLLEEPADNTLFILISKNEENLLQTIRSRCQILHFPSLSENSIAEALVNNEEIDSSKATEIAHRAQGNYNRALQLCTDMEDNFPFEEWFVTWVRAAFRAKGNASAIQDLITWSEQIANLGREIQKKFLNFCIDMFRQALLLNYETPKLVYIETTFFDLSKFSPFVNGGNIHEIFEELSKAIYHIERNGNAKIILTDLSIKLTRLIHKK